VSRKISRTRRVLLTVVVTLTALAVGVAVAMGTMGSSPATPKLQSSAHGALSESNSLNGGAILSASNLAPGGSVEGEVTIGNTGTGTGSLSLSTARLSDSRGPGGGALSKALDLEVTDVTAGSDLPIYSGKLGAMPVSRLVTLTSGDERTYRFVATLADTGTARSGSPADNVYQHASIRVDYMWTLSSSDAPSCGDLMRGDSDANRLVGTSAGDRILGRAGADVIRGRAGADCALGGAGPDSLHGGRENDRLRGGRGSDRIGGGGGRDVLLGGRGSDVLNARDWRHDKVRCGAGHRDVAFVDSQDAVRRCEIVHRRAAR
jgi:Ca2+-binding RTX toxin-like protein